MYNAMTYQDVKSFSLQLLEDLANKYAGKSFAEYDKSYKNGLKKRDLDDDEIANLVAKTLSAFSGQTKILVIDEIDAFEAYENSFRTLTKAILTSKSNTIIIGIANSVDLPFKKKHSAIAMRDTQLLFEPYSEDQIISIMEEKINMKFATFPMRLKAGSMKSIFFNLLDERAMDMIAKKVSKMNGDARVAFDLLKSSFTELYNRVKYVSPNDTSEERKGDEGLPSEDKIKITLEIVCKVMADKYNSKLPQTLRCLPRQNLIVLESIVNIYSDFPSGEDRMISYLELQQEVETLCK
jgi:Cdc6-like AAA superfamily ATPase